MQRSIYRAVQVSSPGKLELVERVVTDPPPGKVRISVEACGVCHSDALTVERRLPNLHVGGDSIDISGAQLVLASRSIQGALTGSAIDGEDTLSFCVLGNVRPMMKPFRSRMRLRHTPA